MKERKVLKTVYILSVLSLFLPWFTYNPKVMGYCWGFSFLGWFLVPNILLAVYLFLPKKNAMLTLLEEVCAAANLAVLVLALGKWQEVHNITSGFHWQDGLHTAMPTYWLSVMLFTVFFILFQWDLIKSARDWNQ